eukprot:15476223-Alexandrium_andersonii.AAC.1
MKTDFGNTRTNTHRVDTRYTHKAGENLHNTPRKLYIPHTCVPISTGILLEDSVQLVHHAHQSATPTMRIMQCSEHPHRSSVVATEERRW